MPTETITLEGHIIDSLLLPKVLDLIGAGGGTHVIERIEIGTTREEPSCAVLRVSAPDAATLEAILVNTQQHGAIRAAVHDARLVPADRDGVFPDDFYATTNLETQVRVDGRWLPVQNIEMDCGVVVEGGAARVLPMAQVRAGDQLVVGYDGVQVAPLERPRPVPDGTPPFAFMSSEASVEKPKGALIARVAGWVRAARGRGEGVLLVGGPAIVHTGAGPHLEALIRKRMITLLFAGNALAAHDIESALYGTSLGVNLVPDLPAPEHGHTHHLRAINAVRRAGGIRQAVESGLLTRGVMHACIETGTPYVLAGSVRDDGPLPDVLTDTQAAQQAMREALRAADVRVCLMVATTLHSIATGNLLPARTATVCVDQSGDNVTKLLDRGSFQSLGIVTDCEWFLQELAERLG